MTDTSDEARRRQLDVYADMDGADKVMRAVEMAEQSKTIAIEGIRSRNPGFSEAQVHYNWLRLLHGDRADRFQDTLTSRDS